ncbi:MULTISPECIES: hypothetical protein [Microbacterium]|jgi:hypothetical protein|uniref:hypothetical protein n=2 Tax=Microbacterium TaxID=33882 RepID=UPI00109B88E5|nr:MULTISPECIES: hypothetical protein [Microbacterium]MCT1394416.1 hypothetical protein [Microbacterium sp. p3-SID338]QYM64949.1 hypothetical protein K1X59_03535 [Microbacterium sp. Se5.02b]
MITSGRSRNQAASVDKLLITKIITGLGLALLLIVGAWSGGHRDADASPYLTATSTASMETELTSYGAVGSSTHGSGGASSERLLIDGASANALIGLTGCVFGLVCSFLILIVARAFVNRVPNGNRERLPRMPEMRAAPDRPFARTLSLTQLSLSRT